MAGEFKAFLLRGNVVDLAVAVVIGGAFGKIVTSLVNDLLMPVLGLLLGGVNFAELKYVIAEGTETMEEAAIRYGAFLQSVLDFVLIGLAIFLAVKAMNSFKRKQEEAPAPAEPPKQEVLLEEIRDLLKKKA
ncbi:large-conductance mechanosensitive channel protein MscL [Anaerotalea alkaliphila]|uniref:Large-conductance mechanosensitive channel n=1 Tax=Anaerotalea alkaliphila TaxID=2662126 RepID=A0A7X5HTR8_9FIRM|nr:large-conductance mechanosensitive channel protein MscL [Anaerotalea alkaliphila]NDL66522.1 large-conductance mechanosensitive channel protein MscL [Anaerotalea alkaliphila]